MRTLTLILSGLLWGAAWPALASPTLVPHVATVPLAVQQEFSHPLPGGFPKAGFAPLEAAFANARLKKTNSRDAAAMLGPVPVVKPDQITVWVFFAGLTAAQDHSLCLLNDEAIKYPKLVATAYYLVVIPGPYGDAFRGATKQTRPCFGPLHAHLDMGGRFLSTLSPEGLPGALFQYHQQTQWVRVTEAPWALQTLVRQALTPPTGQ